MAVSLCCGRAAKSGDYLLLYEDLQVGARVAIARAVLARADLAHARPLKPRPANLCGWASFLERRTQLLPEFRCVGVFVHRDCVLDCGLEQLIIAVSREYERAFHFAWIITAIDVFARHLILLSGKS